MMRKSTMIVRKEYISQLGLTAIQQINGELATGRLEIERIVSMSEKMIEDRVEVITIFYAA